VRASAHEKKIIRLWIESAAVYPGTYAALGSGMVGSVCGDAASRSVLKTRCSACHPRADFPLHSAYNLTRPEKSLILLAPLARAAGGYGMTRKTGKGDQAAEECIEVFRTPEDPGYQALLAGIRAASQQLQAIKRFDMPGFRPNPHYIREMQFYGILPQDLGPDAPIDVYKTDQAYWRSLWHRVEPLASR